MRAKVTTRSSRLSAHPAHAAAAARRPCHGLPSHAAAHRHSTDPSAARPRRAPPLTMAGPSCRSIPLRQPVHRGFALVVPRAIPRAFSSSLPPPPIIPPIPRMPPIIPAASASPSPCLWPAFHPICSHHSPIIPDRAMRPRILEHTQLRAASPRRGCVDRLVLCRSRKLLERSCSFFIRSRWASARRRRLRASTRAPDRLTASDSTRCSGDRHRQTSDRASETACDRKIRIRLIELKRQVGIDRCFALCGIPAAALALATALCRGTRPPPACAIATTAALSAALDSPSSPEPPGQLGGADDDAGRERACHEQRIGGDFDLIPDHGL